MNKIIKKRELLAIFAAILVLLPLNQPISAFRLETPNTQPEVNSCEVNSCDVGPEAKKTFYITVTAYSSTPDQTDSTPFITANGSHVYDGTLAANFLPFGAKVRFPDYSGKKIYTVEDRMNRRFPNRADIWFETRTAALQFGKRQLKMEVLSFL